MTILCADCGEKYDLNVIVSSEDWERIADDGAYMLCYRCMNRRATERGMLVECQFNYGGSGMRTANRMPCQWRPREMCSEIGHPALRKWRPNGDH